MVSVNDALQAIFDALPESVLGYTLSQSGHGASVHFVATDGALNLIDVYGYGCDIEDAWKEACGQIKETPCDHEMVESHGGPILCQKCLKTDTEPEEDGNAH